MVVNELTSSEISLQYIANELNVGILLAFHWKYLQCTNIILMAK